MMSVGAGVIWAIVASPFAFKFANKRANISEEPGKHFVRFMGFLVVTGIPLAVLMGFIG